MMYRDVLNYTKSYLNMIRILFWVSNLTFLNLCILVDVLVLNVCLEKRFFTTCFQQSAKC